MTYDDTSKALEKAIQNSLDQLPGKQGLLVDWIVIAVQENVTADGVYDSAIAVLTPAARFPVHRILGLLDHASTTFRAMIANQRPGTE